MSSTDWQLLLLVVFFCLFALWHWYTSRRFERYQKACEEFLAEMKQREQE